jgi:hypothetical protein
MPASHNRARISSRNVKIAHNAPLHRESSTLWLSAHLEAQPTSILPIQKLLLNQDRSVGPPVACQVLLCQAQLPQGETFPCVKHHTSHISYSLAL